LELIVQNNFPGYEAQILTKVRYGHKGKYEHYVGALKTRLAPCLENILSDFPSSSAVNIQKVKGIVFQFITSLNKV
jgi:hypothetical protein